MDESVDLTMPERRALALWLAWFQMEQRNWLDWADVPALSEGEFMRLFDDMGVIGDNLHHEMNTWLDRVPCTITELLNKVGQ